MTLVVCVCVCVCVLLVHRLAVWVSTGVGHAHTVVMSGPGAQPDVNGVTTRLGRMVLRGCVWQSRSSGHNGYPSGSGRLGGDEGTIWLYHLLYLRRCGDGPLRPEGWYSMTTHPVIHDDPDRRPNRNALTITGPSTMLRCGFGKGTP